MVISQIPVNICNTATDFQQILNTDNVREIKFAQWDEVDMKAGFVRLKPERTKEKRAKIIPINGHVRQVLEGIPRAIHHNNVFTYQGKPITDNMRKSLVTACKVAGIEYGQHIEGGFRFHDIRTTVKTNMKRAGIDESLRNIILGHSLKGMDTYYIKPTEADLHRAIERYTQWLDESIKILKSISGNNQ